jgi:CRISPR-associated exonuclease Cas4
MQDASLSGTHIAYAVICRRKLWLYAWGIQLEQAGPSESPGQGRVQEGKALEEEAYPERASRYQSLDLSRPEEGLFAKVDYFDPQEQLIHETKYSPKLAEAHRWQLRFYLWLLQRQGVSQPTGRIEYPRQRKTEDVTLSEEEAAAFPPWLEELRTLMRQAECPPRIDSPICKHCAYVDFCYAEPDA